MKRKLVWRNERTLYKRACDFCGKSIITIHHPRYPAPVYCFECHRSDKWDPYSYGLIYDSSRPFFEQLGKLMIRIPKAATHVGTGGSQNINSEYVNFAGGNKNCYLIFNSTHNEDCSYSRGIANSKNVTDSYFGNKSELVYEGINVNKSSRINWGENVVDSIDSSFVLNCVGIQNCFGCVNLRHKSYYFFNEPLPKDDWVKRVSEIMGSYQKMEEVKKRFKEFSLKFIRRENNNLKSVNCFGEYIFESKNCAHCFESFNCEDSKYSFATKLMKDSYDVVGRGMESELLLETVATGSGSSRILGSWSVETSHDVEYSYDLRGCEYCSGCAGLKHARYCILNKQFSEGEYKKTRDKIIGELKDKGLYGLYFSPELSPWAYNETLAQEFYPLTKGRALAEGFRWEDEIPRTEGKETLQPEQIPDNIRDIKDSILDEILKCEDCGYNYRIIRPELEFYRRMLIPAPHKCFNCRHLDRIRRRGSFKLHHRKCAKCKRSIQTTYPPDRPEIVYCEKCYQTEVV